MTHGRAPGFTIIEMLVVIAIAGILIAILLPCFCCTHCGGDGTETCLSRLKQLGMASAMYLQDHDDTLFWNPAPGGLPRSRSADQKPGACAPQPRTSFALLLYPYLKSPSVLQCPRYQDYNLDRHLGYAKSLAEADPSRCIWNATDPGWYGRIGYGFNEVLVADPCRPRTLASLKHEPREVALFADAPRPWASSTGVWAEQNGRWGRFWVWNPAEPPRHFEGQSFVFLDGHACRLRPVREDGEGEVGTRAGDRGYFPGARLE
jgi:prepilin-type N-terminal cleavage/methylation domain-containing protein